MLTSRGVLVIGGWALKSLLRMVSDECRHGAFAEDASAATALEYAFLAGLIALGVVGGLSAIGTPLNDWYLKLASAAAQYLGPVNLAGTR